MGRTLRVHNDGGSPADAALLVDLHQERGNKGF